MNKVTLLIKKYRVLISFVVGMIFSSAIGDTDAGTWIHETTHDAMAAISELFFEPEEKTLWQKIGEKLTFWKNH